MSEENPAPEPVSDPASAPSAAPSSAPSSGQAAPPQRRFVDRLWSLRAVIAVALASVIIGGLGGAAIAKAGEHQDGNRFGPGGGGFRGGPGGPGRGFNRHRGFGGQQGFGGQNGQQNGQPPGAPSASPSGSPSTGQTS